MPYLFSCYDGTPSAGCHSTNLSHDGTPIMGCHDVFYSWWNFLNGMSWLAHYVSWWNSLTYGDVMTTKYLYKGETTSRMQIVIETVPVHHVKNRLFQFIILNTETVPVHLVKYRDYSSYKWFSDSNDFLLLSFLYVKISLWFDSNHCQECFLYMYISINFCLFAWFTLMHCKCKLFQYFMGPCIYSSNSFSIHENSLPLG